MTYDSRFNSCSMAAKNMLLECRVVFIVRSLNTFRWRLLHIVMNSISKFSFKIKLKYTDVLRYSLVNYTLELLQCIARIGL